MAKMVKYMRRSRKTSGAILIYVLLNFQKKKKTILIIIIIRIFILIKKICIIFKLLYLKNKKPTLLHFNSF